MLIFIDIHACRREALLMWKEKKGRQATYINLIRIFEGAGNQQCADFIRHNLISGKSQSSLVPKPSLYLPLLRYRQESRS